MKKNSIKFISGYLLTGLFLIINFSLNAQISIGSGTTFSLGSSTLSLPGNWNNNGTLNAGTGTIIFNGASGNQTISNSSGDSFYNITINKASGDVQLSSSIFLDDTLTLTSGDLDMNGDSIILGPSAYVSESAGNTVKGSGLIEGTVIINAPSSVNVFGLGATISSTENLGGTTISRGNTEQTANGATSILRYFDITPANNSGLNATLVFSYDDSELNGHTESNLVLFRSSDNGTNWFSQGGTVNTSSNTVTLNGINSFSRWTISDDGALPVELVSFTSNAVQNGVNLSWKTSTETNNYGFEIEKKLSLVKSSEEKWEKLGFVKGNGNSNSTREYSFTDNISKHYSGKVQYRLKQIDNNGNFSYSEVSEVEIAAPKEFVLYQNYPNPFNPETSIEFTVPEDGEALLKIYNVNGEEVSTIFNGFAEAGKYQHVKFNASNLASGIYYARLQYAGNVSIKKMIMIK